MANNDDRFSNPTMRAAMDNMSAPAPMTLEQKLDDALRRIATLENSLAELTNHYEAEMTADRHPLLEKFEQIMDALQRHNILEKPVQKPLPSSTMPALVFQG